jgi:hypothetical protein
MLAWCINEFLRVRESDDAYRTIYLRTARHKKGDIKTVLLPELIRVCQEQGNRISTDAKSLIGWYGFSQLAELVDDQFVFYKDDFLKMVYLVAPLWDGIGHSLRWLHATLEAAEGGAIGDTTVVVTHQSGPQAAVAVGGGCSK